MKYKKILKKVKSKKLSIESAFIELEKLGYCPDLISDDNGRWAVYIGGYQDVVTGKEPCDVNSSFFIEAEMWHKNIRNALIYTMSE